ncbi:MAG: pyrroline-5-carboxylate reductase [Verrucomicrobia bacterium]|nr:pyrroline-5-carboxylate reductase [Verrucomicrobiota bacterium]
MRIAIIGCGVMGSAFARQFAKKGHELVLCDHFAQKGEALAKELRAKFQAAPINAVKGAEVVLLAIKPKDLGKIKVSLKGKTVISILAGTTLETLKRRFAGAKIVRAMPNLALTQGEAVIALAGEKIDEVDQLLKGMGLIFWTQEEKIDPITALAGSGPAFVIAIIEALTESGIELGLPAAEAQELVLQTIMGAVALVKAGKGHPGQIRWQISAPAGTTIAGLAAFEECGVRSGIRKTILATYKRAKELS